MEKDDKGRAITTKPNTYIYIRINQSNLLVCDEVAYMLDQVLIKGR